MTARGPLLLSGLLILTATAGSQAPGGGERTLYNPYERLKNGPPLSGVFHKAKTSWIQKKLRDPRHQGLARMPRFQFTEKEILDIMAYLESIAGAAPPPAVPWPAWAAKGFEDLGDDESDVVFDLVDRGKAVWSNARCSICHAINGPEGKPIGAFVDLRVGGMSLREAGIKLERDWLFRWINEPKSYFPDTLMPHFRFEESDIKALVEYILRDDVFRPETEASSSTSTKQDWSMLADRERAARGKRLIRTSRCVVCHDIEGIPEVLPGAKRLPPPAKGTFEFLAYDVRCLTCHSIAGRGGTYAPDLTGEGSRLRRDWITSFVKSPDMVRPLSQQMPRFNLSEAEAELVADYMSGSRLDRRVPNAIPGGPPKAKELREGRKTYQAKGCIACHTIGEGPGGSVGPDLGTVGDRLKPGYIWYHIQRPHAVNAYSAEPEHGLSDAEARALAVYLASKKARPKKR